MADSFRESAARCEIDGGVFSAIIDLDIEIDPVTFVERMDASALDGADMDEAIGSAIVTLDEAEALRAVEEFDLTRGALSGQLAACPLRLFRRR